MTHLKYIVTGTGRCGTVYAARLLTSVGVPCGHESVFDSAGAGTAAFRVLGSEDVVLSYCSQAKRNQDGSWTEEPKWLDLQSIEADSSYMAAPLLVDYPECKVIHLTRHPIKVVHSFCNYIDYFQSHKPLNHYERFIYKWLPVLRQEMPQHDRAVWYYVKWNELIELRKDATRIRIEDCPSALLGVLGKSGECFNDPSINSFQRPKQRFCLDDVKDEHIKERFIEMGERYGYTMSSEYLLA